MPAICSYTLEQTRQEYGAARPRLLDELRRVIRRKNYSIRTEVAYVDWVRRFVHFCDLTHPRECGAAHVGAFLTHLAVEGRVTAATQNQARSALLFFYRRFSRYSFRGSTTSSPPSGLAIARCAHGG